MVSREDLLHELELLPVWQSRNPAPQPLVNADLAINFDAVEVVAAQDTIQTEVAAHQAEQAVELPTCQFRLIASDDGQWVFVLGQQQDSEAEQLLQNMLKAVSVTINQDMADANEAQLNQIPAKAIVVMGENEAQQLLNETQTLEQLRGKPHLLQETPVIVTYSPSYLMLNLSEKAKAWEDLCLAKLTIANL